MAVDMGGTVGAECVAEFRYNRGRHPAHFYLAWKRGYSPLEMVSGKVDEAFVETLRKRFGTRIMG